MKNIKISTSIKLIVMTFLVLSYQNCSVVQKGSSENASVSGQTAMSSLITCEPALLEAFKTDLHPFVSVQCAKCHRAGGLGKTKFAEADFDTAWNQFKTIGTVGPQKIYNNGTSPSHSGDSTITGPQNEPILKSALDKYNNSVIGCLAGTTGTLSSQKSLNGVLELVNNQITPATEKVLAWNLNEDLNTKSGVDYGEAYFIISVSKSTDGISYVVYNPRIRTYEKEIHIANIQIYINGKKIETTSTFLLIDTEVPTYTSEQSVNGTLSSLSSNIPYKIDSSDYLQVSFGKLEAK